MTTTPRKPTHPDMGLLEQILQGQDAAAEGGQELGDMVAVDPEVLMYAAFQRVLRVDRLLRHHDQNTVHMSIWLDAFCAGMTMAQRKEGER